MPSYVVLMNCGQLVGWVLSCVVPMNCGLHAGLMTSTSHEMMTNCGQHAEPMTTSVEPMNYDVRLHHEVLNLRDGVLEP